MIQAQADSHQQKNSVTLTIPSWLLAIFKLVDYGANKALNATGEVAGNITSKAPKLKFSFNLKDKTSNVFSKFFAPIKKHKKAAFLVLVLVLVAIGSYGFSKARSGANSQALIGSGTSSSLDSSKVNVNKTFSIPIKSSDGKPTGQDLKVTVTTIEQTDSILIQNKPAKTKNGKTFLLVNMEIQNDTKTELKIKPVDMVRLVSSDGKNFAADVYNNDVSAKAVSIQKTRVGYVVEKSQRTFRLLIGEVRGTQEPIDVNF